MRRLTIALSLFAVLLSAGSMILPYQTIDAEPALGIFQNLLHDLVKSVTKSGWELIYPLLSPILCLAAFILVLIPSVRKFVAFLPAIVNLIYLGAIYRYAYLSEVGYFSFPTKPGIGFYTGLVAALLLLVAVVLHWITFKTQRKKATHADLLDL